MHARVCACMVMGGTGFGPPKLFYCCCCIKLMLMIRLKVCEVCDIYALGYELRVECWSSLLNIWCYDFGGGYRFLNTPLIMPM